MKLFNPSKVLYVTIRCPNFFGCNGRNANEAPDSAATSSARDNHRRASRRQSPVVKLASLISTTRCLFTNRFSAVSVVPPVWLVQLILS